MPAWNWRPACSSARQPPARPCPHILAADNSPAALGNPYLICEAINGETIVRRIHRTLDDAARARLLQQCAQALAAIHRPTPTAWG